MTNKLIFLGTGGGRYVTAHQWRSTGGIILSLDKMQIHIDPGPGSLSNAKISKVDPTQTSVVLVSHHDIDHCNDLNCVIDSLNNGGIKSKGILISTNTLINGSQEEHPFLTNYHKKSLTKIKALKPGEKIKIDNLTFEALRTKHSTEDCIGFKIFSDIGIITYSSDTEFSSSIADQYKKSDVLILNTLVPSNKRIKGHLCSEDAVEIIKKVKPKLAIIQHFGKTMLDADPRYEARNITNESGIQTIEATDHLEIDLDSFFLGPKQKTLTPFQQQKNI